MASYVLRRGAQFAIVILGVVTVSFVLLRISGDPSTLFVDQSASPEDIARVRASLGFDRPLIEQYVSFVTSALIGNFGTSLRFSQPAMSVVLERLPATLELATAALVLVTVTGLTLGSFAAVRRGSLLDKLTIGLALIGQSVPTFVIGIVLIMIFAVQLRWFPTSGRGSPNQLVLPALTLALFETARIARLMRSSMLGVLQEDYIRTARAKGLSEYRVVVGHAAKNALLAAATVIGLSLSALLGGAIVTETIFAWPGIGSLLVAAVTARDYNLVQACVAVVGLLVAGTTLLTDLLYGAIDPRIRVASRG